MPGKTRVSSLAKELNITSRDALRILSELGEYVKSASSTFEAPAARKLRERCTGNSRPSAQPVGPTGPRSYPRNNPYMDLGKSGIDHQQAADRWYRERPEPPMRGPRPRGSDDPAPGRVAVDPFQASRPRAPRREWYRGAEPSEFDLHVLDTVIVARRDRYAAVPKPPWRYFEDEVQRAREITGRWMPMLLSGLDYDEILAWREALDPISTAWFVIDYKNAVDDATNLAAARVTPGDLAWRYGDEKHGTLPDRLREGILTVDEVIIEVENRRHSD